MRRRGVKALMGVIDGSRLYSCFLLVMFVEANADDVVPTCRIVALETLVHARVLLVGELLGDHRKMLHEMTRRSQMTLHAFFGSGRWMLIPEHRPRFEGVALRAVGSEPIKVWILTIMASGTVENFTGGVFFELTGTLNSEPGLQEC